MAISIFLFIRVCAENAFKFVFLNNAFCGTTDIPIVNYLQYFSKPDLLPAPLGKREHDTTEPCRAIVLIKK